MIESPDILAEESAVEADEIDFVPDPSQLARVPRDGGGVPRWLIAGMATAGVLTALLLMKPGPRVAAAAGPEEPAQIAQPAHQDLFQLPEWQDEPADRTGGK